MKFNYRDLGLQDGKVKHSSMMYRVYLAFLSGIVDNWPKAQNATISSNVLKPGVNHFFIDGTAKSVQPNAAAGESPGTMGLELNIDIEGLSRPSLEWLYGINGERVLGFWENCMTHEKFIGGTPCSGGLLATVTSIGKLESGFMGAVLNLKGDECPDPFYFYDGPIVREDPEIIATDAVTFALTEKSQYQLPNNTAATVLTGISDISDDQVGRVIELIGTGTTFPTRIESSNKFILSNGVSWDAKQGSTISFQIYKSGANDYIFLEVYRS